MGHVQDSPVATTMISNECMIYHMKGHIASYNLDQIFFSKSKINILTISGPMSIKPAIVLGVPGVLPWHPQILEDQLTLSQQRGTDYDLQIILAPPDFQTFRRP